MREWMLRFGLSLMVTVGIWTDRVSAQAVAAPFTDYSRFDPNLMIVPTIAYEPAYHPPYPPAFYVPPPPPRVSFLHWLINSHGLGCSDASPFGVCSNFHSEFRFVFGSCRDFFTESCGAHRNQTDTRGGCGR